MSKVPQIRKPSKSSIEQAWRPLIPVDSFVEDRVEPVITKRPDVGLRWGKPSEFEFQLPEKKKRSSKDYGATIKYPRWYFWEHDVKDFTEQFRTFKLGEIAVQLQTPEDFETWEDWRLNVVESLSISNNVVEIEEMLSWTFNSGLSYQTPHSNVSIFFKFNMEPQLPFLLSPNPPKEGSRGNPPGGEPIIPRIKSLDERRLERSNTKTVE